MSEKPVYTINFKIEHPCEFLGRVTDRLGGCNCPYKWVRACSQHKTTTIEFCAGQCPDYTPADPPVADSHPGEAS